MKKTIGNYQVSYDKDYTKEMNYWNKLRVYSTISAVFCFVLAFLVNRLFSNMSYLLFVIVGVMCMLPSYYYAKADLKSLFSIISAFSEDRIIDIKEETTNHKGIRKLNFYYEDDNSDAINSFLFMKEKLNTNTNISYRHISLDGNYIEIPFNLNKKNED